MSVKIDSAPKKVQSFSILAFSKQATKAYRFFTKEDFLNMMSDMSIEDIISDLERFKELEEYEICQKIQFVVKEKKKVDQIHLSYLL